MQDFIKTLRVPRVVGYTLTTSLFMKKHKNSHSIHRHFYLLHFLQDCTNPWPSRNIWSIITLRNMTTRSLTSPAETELGTTHPKSHLTLQQENCHWWLPEHGIWHKFSGLSLSNVWQQHSQTSACALQHGWFLKTGPRILKDSLAHGSEEIIQELGFWVLQLMCVSVPSFQDLCSLY